MHDVCEPNPSHCLFHHFNRLKDESHIFFERVCREFNPWQQLRAIYVNIHFKSLSMVSPDLPSAADSQSDIVSLAQIAILNGTIGT
jgi:hypothetical protein